MKAGSAAIVAHVGILCGPGQRDGSRVKGRSVAFLAADAASPLARPDG